jgi:hypothetical protein
MREGGLHADFLLLDGKLEDMIDCMEGQGNNWRKGGQASKQASKRKRMYVGRCSQR